MSEKNLILPGNPRYQPPQMKPFFGYDNLYHGVGMVELATMKVLCDIRIIPKKDYNLLTSEIIEAILNIRTTEVDKIERSKTKHDIRAWIYLAKEILPEPLHRWVHVPLTSYDPIETGTILRFQQAYEEALLPSINRVILLLAKKVEEFTDTVQIGRTHGQHALPITVGFWFATILNRILENREQMNNFSLDLVGKISGAVGAHNAQFGLGFSNKDRNFEKLVLEELGLRASRISTQILPPEPLTYFLFSCLMMTQVFGQFGRDCRHLMRTEIGEIQEEFEEGQAGSSTMAHKRNPINFENMEGVAQKTNVEFGKILFCSISEHQRDLTGSSIMRDFPIILINLQHQLNTLLRENASGVTFLERIKVSKEACEKNLDMSINVVMAEPLYIALQMAGYDGDAHHLVNHELMPMVQNDSSLSLTHALIQKGRNDDEIMNCFQKIPTNVRKQLSNPKDYIGDSVEKSMEIVCLARKMVNETKPV